MTPFGIDPVGGDNGDDESAIILKFVGQLFPDMLFVTGEICGVVQVYENAQSMVLPEF